MKKILLILAALIVLVIIAFAVLIKVYVTPEKIKEVLILTVEENLNRKVSIGELDISLFRGIVVKDFAIKEADGETDFLKAEAFVLKYELLPLLFKKVIIDELKIVSPEIRIVRDREGKFNFENIGKEKPAEVKGEKEADKATGLPVSLLISRAAIKDANFSFQDYKKELPDVKGSININASFKSADAAELIFEGNMDLRLDEVVIKEPSKRQFSDITAGLKYRVNIDLKSDSITINRADLKVQKISAFITGDVTNITTEPVIDIAVSIPRTKAADILESVSPFIDTNGIALSGNIMADLKIKGRPEKFDTLKTYGRINLGKVGIAYEDISAVIDGNLRFEEQSMNIDIKGTTGRNTANLKGSVKSYFKNPKIKLNLYSKRLFLDELIPAGTTKASPPVGKGAPASVKEEAEEAKPLDLKLTANGEIKVDSVIYKGISLNNFYTKYQLKDNRFEIIKMTALVEKGRFNLQGLVDLSKPGYTYNLTLSLDSLHANKVVNVLFPKAKNTVYGVLSSNFKLNGAGTLPENIKKNLIANGDFNIKDGKITNSKIPEALAEFLGIEELRTIKLKQAEGTVKIRDGVAKLDSVFSSNDLSMNPSGNIGLDETLDLAFDLKLSPRLTDKALMNLSIASYIKDEAGWGTIPLMVSGTFSNPSYSVDIAKAGKRVIKKEVEEFLKDIFDKKEDGKKKEIDAIKDILKDLF